MKVAITGPDGQLGSELVRQGCIPLRGRFFSPHLASAIDAIKPDAIINTAAHTAVDRCEDRIAVASDVNMRGVSFLSNWFDGYLIQISTDYIFDGLSGPYSPNDPPNPLSIYGWSKLGGELIARRHKGPWLIIRTTVLFSGANNNFVAKVVKRLEQGEKVILYQPNLIGTPTYVPALGEEIIRLVKEEYTGVAHVAGRVHMTRLEFARLIACAFGFDPNDIEPVDTIDASYQAAPRPYKAGLVSDHDGFRPVNSHSAADGLRELAERYKRGEIWR